jgi:Na+/H+ antiporter NhaD/arsenite permease-like protein
MSGLFQIPPEFIVFGLTLLGVALFHRHALAVALAGLFVASLYALITFPEGLAAGALDFATHFAEEWAVLINLFLLLLGFAVLANQFERSHLPQALPAWLPEGWHGGFVLLSFVFVLSIFLDNIAGAIIGGVVARHVYRNKVGIGFLAAIVAAANAGGAGSVIGDTTTTMMWISGISALEVAPAFIGAIAALLAFGVPAAFQQHHLCPIKKDTSADIRIDGTRVIVVALLLLALLLTNLVGNSLFPELHESLPMLGLGLWAAILATAPLRQPHWRILTEASMGAIFLVALVALASLMPVETLPEPSPTTVFGLGVLSAVFDNIPLTALAINQGGYDWALLAYAVGFGGSMVWFGSSAGVALANLYPEGRSVGRWLWLGWHVPVAYGVGFVAMLLAGSLYG